MLIELTSSGKAVAGWSLERVLAFHTPPFTRCPLCPSREYARVLVTPRVSHSPLYTMSLVSLTLVCTVWLVAAVWLVARPFFSILAYICKMTHTMT